MAFTTRLRREIVQLRAERERCLVLDPEAITNGTIRRLDRAIDRLRDLIAEASEGVAA